MLARTALRWATVRALRGQTFARRSVEDSRHAALDDLDSVTGTLPLIAVYTDDIEGPVQGRDLIRVTGEQQLHIDFAIHGSVEIDETKHLGLLASDPAMEFHLDLIERQIIAALTEVSTPWSDFWQQLVLSIGSKSCRRGFIDADGTKGAARRLTLNVTLAADPRLASMPSGIWPTFIALCERDPELKILAPMVVASMTGDRAATQAAVKRMRAGFNRAEERALGLAQTPPLQEPADDNAANSAAA